MLRLSERQSLLNEVDMVLEMLTLSGSEHSKDFSDFMELRFALSAVRYLNLRKHLAKRRSMQQMLFQYGPNDFKQVVRTDVRSFERLLTLISDDPAYSILIGVIGVSSCMCFYVLLCTSGEKFAVEGYVD